MVFRLGCMLDNDVPTKAWVDAESIILQLSREPQAIMRPAFTDCILNLQPPHCVITYEEHDSLYRAAIIADSGLAGAVECLLQPVERPPSFSYLRALRVALAVVNEELSEGDEHEVLQEFWTEGSCSLETCLVDTFIGLSDEISRHFSVEPPPAAAQDILAQMFRAASETIAILVGIVPTYALPGRTLRAFTVAAANVFVCTDIADILFSQTSPACVAAQDVRQACVSVIRSMAEISEPLPGGKSTAQVILRTLLEHGLHSGSHEPAHHLLQVFCLIDYLLPTPESEDLAVAWNRTVLPVMLRELSAFCRALDTENKAHFIRRLVALDKGAVGLGEWIILEELKELSRALGMLQNPDATPHHRLLRQYQTSLSLRLLLDLTTGPSSEAAWCVKSLTTNLELAQAISTCLELCLVANISSTHLTKILRILASESAEPHDVLKPHFAMVLLRTAQHPPGSASDVTSSLYLTQAILLSCPTYLLMANQVSMEISNFIRWLESSTYLNEGDLPSALVDLIEWFTSIDDPTIMGYSRTSFGSFCDKLKPCLAVEKQEALAHANTCLRFIEEAPSIAPITPLPDSIELSVQEVEDLLQPRTAAPSTPPRKALNQDVLSLVAISPPTAVIRSPAITGLTKTYSNNDFRQLRQTPSARQNTSRLPSMHVDVGSTF